MKNSNAVLFYNIGKYKHFLNRELQIILYYK